MGFTAMSATEIAIGKPVDTSFLMQVKNNLDYLNSVIGIAGQNYGAVLNGGFEQDSDGDGIPDQWTITPFTGGTFHLATTATVAEILQGNRTLIITHPGGDGNGGAELLSDYFPIIPLCPILVSAQMAANSSGLVTNAYIKFFTANKSSCTPDQSRIMRITTSSTEAETYYGVGVASDTLARFAQLHLALGSSEATIAGIMRIDNVKIENPAKLPLYLPMHCASFTTQTGNANTWADLISLGYKYFPVSTFGEYDFTLHIPVYVRKASTAYHSYFRIRTSDLTPATYITLTTADPAIETTEYTRGFSMKDLEFSNITTGGFKELTIQSYNDTVYGTGNHYMIKTDRLMFLEIGRLPGFPGMSPSTV